MNKLEQLVSFSFNPVILLIFRLAIIVVMLLQQIRRFFYLPAVKIVAPLRYQYFNPVQSQPYLLIRKFSVSLNFSNLSSSYF